MSTTISPSAPPVPGRSVADRRMRRVLRLPDGPPASMMGAESVFGRSIFISATRCLITYLLIPFLTPVLNLQAGIGPWLGIVLSLVAMVALIAAVRRFFAADHKWRWQYFVVASCVFVLVTAQAIIDLRTLVS